MANEIQVTAAIQVDNGYFHQPKIGAEISQHNQTGIGGGVPGTVSISTAEMDVTLGVTNLGWCRMQNIDPTNYVVWGPKSGGAMVPMGKLKPGEAALFRMQTGITLRMAANTAACKVQILVFED